MEKGDLISRAALMESIEGTDWYTIHVGGRVSQGAPSEEVAWYKATEIYAAINSAPAVDAEPVANEKAKRYLECEIRLASERQQNKDNFVYDCELVGRGIAQRLNERHISFCKMVLSLLGEDSELRTCYCPTCDRHFKIRPTDSGGNCPDCGRRVEVADG